MRRPITILALAAVAIALAACAPRPSVRIGYLAQQPHSMLMAELVAETLRQSDIRALTAACSDLLACGRRMQAGDIDLLPSYSGAARVFFRSRAIEEGNLPAVRRVLAEAGMGATPGLGFQAPYVLLMDSTRALQHEITTIEDLARLEQPRFAVPPGYTRQPGDGLLALTRRYGLDIPAANVEEMARPGDRIAALLGGQRDVAILRAPLVRPDLGVTALADSLGFYPRYEATVVLGPRLGDARDLVEAALRPLYNAFQPEEIEAAVREIVVAGRTAEMLARRLLVAKGIIDTESPTVRRPEMVIAYTGAESMSPLDGQAILALRRAFPERPVNMLATASPFAALEQGTADLALVHTSAFFNLTWDGVFRGRDPRGEAIAAVGRRNLLLLARESVTDNPLAARVGIPPGWTAGGRVAARMLVLAGRGPDRRARGPDLVAAVRDGTIDAAIVLLDTETMAAIQALPPGAGVGARNLTELLVAAPFFLNEVRLPTSPVPGEGASIDTLSMQVLLAGPAPRGRGGPVHGGPASAVATRNLPVPVREAEAIAAAVENAELPDPVLPSYRTREAAAPTGLAESSWVETGLILLAAAFMGWAGWLVSRPVSPR